MFHISLELVERREKWSVPLTDKWKLEDGLGKKHKMKEQIWFHIDLFLLL